MQPDSPDQTAPRRYIGESVARIEDARLLRGAARFVDDVKLPNMAAAAILRSPHAHARVTGIDLSAARAMGGVIDVFCAAEIAEDIGADVPLIPVRLAPFESFMRFKQPVIACDTVRYAGEPVAVVVAENRYVAEDALERIAVDYDPLPPVIDAGAATAGGVLVHEAAGDNIAAEYSVDRGDVAAAFASADYTRKETFTTNRQTPCPMETRGFVAEFDTGDAGGSVLRLWGATKVTFYNRGQIASALGLEETSVELIETDIGGGFGVRGELYPEDYLIPIASRRAGRPVKWIEDRREHLMAANHSRDIACELEIAATKDGDILGLRGTLLSDMGAYIRTNGGVVPARAVQFMPGPYRIPAFACDVRAFVTNKTPVGTYRGPGRFEANFFRERLIDMMAADLGLDPAEVRFKNLLQPDELPRSMGDLVPGEQPAMLEPGDYPAALRRLLDGIGYDDWKDRQGEIVDGRAYGLGLACFIESSAAGPPEMARVTAAPDGALEIRVGGSSMGQGLETAMAQIGAEALEADIGAIRVLHGSTTLLPMGSGTYHSRSTVMAGNAVRVAAEALRDKCLDLAALRWNLGPETLVFEQGGVRRTDGETPARLELAELAAFAQSRATDGEPGLSADGQYANQGKLAISYGGHAALVAVDVETGKVSVERYVLIEEIGRAVNPAMLHGQAVGGMVQGLGGTLLDHLIYDEHGQLQTANLADFLLPTSMDVPETIPIATEDYPSPSNPMGFKGGGEGGITAVAAAIGNAVSHALSRHGVQVTRLPLSPVMLREAMGKAEGGP